MLLSLGSKHIEEIALPAPWLKFKLVVVIPGGIDVGFDHLSYVAEFKPSTR